MTIRDRPLYRNLLRRLHTWDDFSGGDRGALSPLHAPANSFSGQNVVPYLNGMIGPRAGLRKLGATLPNFPTGYRAIGYMDSLWFDSGPPFSLTRDIWVGYWDSGASKGKIVCLSSDLYRDTDADIATGDTGAWTPLASLTRPGNAYVTSGAGLYQLAANTPALAGITNAPPGVSVVEWQNVLVVAGTGSDSNKVFWSDDGPLTWPVAPNYTVVGSPISKVMQLFVLRDQLFVFKDDGTIWMITGVLPTSLDATTSASVRLVAALDSKMYTSFKSGTLAADGIWFMGGGSSWPSRCNGSIVSALDYLRSGISTERDGSSYGDAFSTGVRVPGVASCAIADSGLLFIECNDLEPGTSAPAGVNHNMNMLMLNHNAWTKHLPAPRSFTSTTAVTGIRGGKVAILTRTAAGVVEVYVWDANLDQPPDNLVSPVNDYAVAGSVVTINSKKVGVDFSATPGIPMATMLDTSVYEDPDGLDFMVRKVIIDYRLSYVYGMTPGFNMQLIAMNRYAETPFSSSAVQSWASDPLVIVTDSSTHNYPSDQNRGEAGVGGSMRRAEFSVGDQGSGSACYVRLTNLIGVSIAAITIMAVDDGDRTAV